MSESYNAVGWNAFKKKYDLFLTLGIVLFLVLFVVVGAWAAPQMTAEILIMRAFAVAAFFLLHVILCIGPMARLHSSFLPLLYNRRHLGVAMFLLALIHSVLAVVTYHVGGDLNPLVSIFTSDAGSRLTSVPFQAFGFFALLILFVMAATSHDFWLANLSAPIWKSLHMSVYLAYVLLLAHVVFGVLQAETEFVFSTLVGLGFIVVAGLHLYSGWRQKDLDASIDFKEDNHFVNICKVSDLKEDEPFGAILHGERVAVLLYENNKISCVSGVCQHQNGPLAEGRYLHGCLTCPWHGYQYHPSNGKSPEPFTEKIPTFDVKVIDGEVWVGKTPHPAGTFVEPALKSD